MQDEDAHRLRGHAFERSGLKRLTLDQVLLVEIGLRRREALRQDERVRLLLRRRESACTDKDSARGRPKEKERARGERELDVRNAELECAPDGAAQLALAQTGRRDLALLLGAENVQASSLSDVQAHVEERDEVRRRAEVVGAEREDADRLERLERVPRHELAQVERLEGGAEPGPRKLEALLCAQRESRQPSPARGRARGTSARGVKMRWRSQASPRK